MRKLKLVLLLLVSCLLLTAIGVGLEDIYCAYFVDYKGFRVLSVADGTAWNMIAVYEDDIKSPNTALVEALTSWARENEAAMVVYDMNSEGAAVCDCSGQVRRMLIRAGVPEDCPPLDETMRGVYVANDPLLLAAYVRDNVFLPETMSLPVLGVYEKDRMPAGFESWFFYPLCASMGQSETVLTDQKGDLEPLKELILANWEGRSVIEYNNYGGFFGFLRLLVSDGLQSRSRTHVFFTAIGLGLSYVFCGLMLFREHRRELVVRHLFGMSVSRIRGRVLLLAGAVTAAALLLFARILQVARLARLQPEEILLLLGILLGISLLLSAAVILTGMAGVKRLMKGGVRHEGASPGPA